MNEEYVANNVVFSKNLHFIIYVFDPYISGV